MSKAIWVVVVAAILGATIWALVALNNQSYRSGYNTAEGVYRAKLDSVVDWHSHQPPSIKESIVYVEQPGGLVHDTVNFTDTLFTPDSLWHPKFVWQMSYAYTTGLLRGVTADGVKFSKEGVGSFALDGKDVLTFESSPIPEKPKPAKAGWLYGNIYMLVSAQTQLQPQGSALSWVNDGQLGIVPGLVFFNTVRLGVGAGARYNREAGLSPTIFGTVTVRLAGKW